MTTATEFLLNKIVLPSTHKMLLCLRAPGVAPKGGFLHLTNFFTGKDKTNSKKFISTTVALAGKSA
jgi:hypothetical protein